MKHVNIASEYAQKAIRYAQNPGVEASPEPTTPKEVLLGNPNELRRSFGGKTEGFVDKEERAFEKAHLAAYLKGRTHFGYGYFYEKIGIRHPCLHKVQTIWS